MKRARRLLKAYNILNNAPTAIISHISYVVTCIIIGACLISILIGMLTNRPHLVSSSQNISYLSIVMVLLTIRSIYTGFFEDKRQGTKHSLRALTIHLPISKKDFILAQFIGNLYLFLPAFILVLSLVISNSICKTSVTYQFELGAMVIAFSMTYILISLEKGLLTYYYLDPRIREIGYFVLMGSWMLMNYYVETDISDVIERISIIGQNYLWFEGTCAIGGISGIFLMLGILLISYLVHMKLLIMLEGRR